MTRLKIVNKILECGKIYKTIIYDGFIRPIHYNFPAAQNDIIGYISTDEIVMLLEHGSTRREGWSNWVRVLVGDIAGWVQLDDIEKIEFDNAENET